MSWITRERRLAIYLRDNFTCVYCERDLHHVDAAVITLDHIVPRADGGSNHTTNLVTACHLCNSTRRATNYKVFARQNDKTAIRRVNSLRRRRINLSLAKSIIAGRRPKHEATARA